MEKENQKIALLIDAENEPNHIEEVLKNLLERGRVPYRKIYGKTTTTTKAKWQSYENLGLKVDTHSSDKPNATDLCLSIDAMRIMYEKKPDAICIVAGDKDYIPLINAIRENDVYSIIATRQQAIAEKLGKICDEIILLKEKGVKVEEEKQTMEDGLQLKTAQYTNTDQLLVNMAKIILRNAGKKLDVAGLCSKIYDNIKNVLPEYRFPPNSATNFFKGHGFKVEKNEKNISYIGLPEDEE